MLLSPSAIEEVVHGFPELGDEYEVIVAKKGDTDEISLQVEIFPGQEGNQKEILARLKDRLRLQTNLNYLIEFHPFQSLPGLKARPRGLRI